ncbi:hypothetical protein cand_012370 [Cryptosporidium andersoni]|uniref:Uncharacterized protein n=1 Tax=Cryptosporidium andersoni TaxID=117008 RepID=A0A1J4ME88_9CRYT|nr:hypothetical protein cand_012370 [Cryptosporidium andersoni]
MGSHHSNIAQWCNIPISGSCDAIGASFGTPPSGYLGFTSGLAIKVVPPQNVNSINYYIHSSDQVVAQITCVKGSITMSICGQNTSSGAPDPGSYSYCSMIIGLSNGNLVVSPPGYPDASLISLPNCNLILSGRGTKIRSSSSNTVNWSWYTNYNPVSPNANTPTSTGVNNIIPALALPTTTTTKTTNTIKTTIITTTTTTTTTTAAPKLIENGSSYVIVPSIQSITASISFTINIEDLSENSALAILNDNSGNELVSISFNSCCVKLSTNNGNVYDKAKYSSFGISSSSVLFSLGWTASFFYLILTSSWTIIAQIPTLNSTSTPASISLTSNGNNLSTTWTYKTLFSPPQASYCSINGINRSCKATGAQFQDFWSADSTFLRYGFLAPSINNYPIVLSISVGSVEAISISFTNIGITMNSQYTGSSVSYLYKNPPSEGSWIAGDLFYLSPSLYSVLNTLSQATSCLVNEPSCPNEEYNSWMSLSLENTLLTYAYLASQSTTTGASNIGDSVFFLGYNGNIIGNVTVSSYSTFTSITSVNSPVIQPILYYKLVSGVAPEINIANSILSSVKTHILNNEPMYTNNKKSESDSTTNKTDTHETSTHKSWLQELLSWL